MKQYGANKATEFTRKQVNVVFAKAKSGTLKIEKWFVNELYVLADYYGYDDKCEVERSERQVKQILEAVFDNDIEKAQSLINEAEDDWFNSYSRKTQAKCNRTAFVA